MGFVLDLVWACKVFLTVAGAYRYCSENLYSPMCLASAFYSLLIVLAICFAANPRKVMQQIAADEDSRLRSLEEGIEENFPVPHQKNSRFYSFFWQKKLE